jgi:uncharacterized protein (TIGR02466 family)
VVNLKNVILQDLIMNRGERRAQERSRKKNSDGESQIEVEFMQPWSDVLMRTKLPDDVLNGLLEVTDKILQDPNRENWGKNLAGQIVDEPLIPHQMMMDYKIGNDGSIFNWLMNCVGEYVKSCSKQQATSVDFDKVKNVEWLTQMMSAWVVSQWEGEYNPIHVHTECKISTVLYLKVPEFLPSVKPERDDDGCIAFIGGGGISSQLTRNLIKWNPKVGDFFIFPAHLQHCVYPFKTEGDQERRSISFNADFISKEQLEKQQQMQQQQKAPLKPMPRSPETLTINTEK